MRFKSDGATPVYETPRFRDQSRTGRKTGSGPPAARVSGFVNRIPARAQVYPMAGGRQKNRRDGNSWSGKSLRRRRFSVSLAGSRRFSLSRRIRLPGHFRSTGDQVRFETHGLDPRHSLATSRRIAGRPEFSVRGFLRPGAPRDPAQGATFPEPDVHDRAGSLRRPIFFAPGR